MILKYEINIKDNVIASRFKILINQIYKLLPIREENGDWEKPLLTIIEQLAGMKRLIQQYEELFFPLLNKLEGLFTLIDKEDFSSYRRTIFQCLGLMNTLQKEFCKEKQQGV